jgi:RNA polymerase sigma-70 factor (ECF subfamily)
MPFLKSIKTERPEGDLLEAYQRDKDLQALGDLYQRYMDLVYGLCLKYFEDTELARDAVMGIFEVLVRDLAKPNPVQYFKSWLYQVAKNYCLMQLRSAGKGKIVELGQEPVMQSMEDPHLKEENLQRLEKCLEALPEDQRRTILLFYEENKCYNEIADLTGYEWNKVRSHIQNARRNLKICMEKKVHVHRGAQ